ncbi:MAG: GldG family protein [Eubacteriales bacterium]|nr:GldG family protein [Eubacteriales bacterium]
MKKAIRFKVGNILPKWSSKNIKNGSYSLGLSVVVVAIVVVINMIISDLPSKYTEVDLSDTQLYSIGEQTEEIVGALEEDVTLYLVVESGYEDDMIVKLLEKYEELSSHITVETKDPVVNPGFTAQYTDDSLSSNSIIAVSEKRSKVIQYSDMYETAINYYSYSYETTGFDGEGQITSAIDYVTSENLPIMYVLQGHDESSMTEDMKSLIEKGNIEMQDLNLVTAESVPEDADCLFIYAPQKDLSEEEAQKIIEYLENGGKAFIISGYTQTEMPNLASVLADYGLETMDGVVFEGDPNYYISGNPTYLVPEIMSADATGAMANSNTYVLMPIAQGIRTLDSYRDTITITSLLKTSDSAYIKTDTENLTTMEKEDGDESGSFDLAVAVTETFDDKETKLIYMTSPNLFNEQIDAMVSGGNTQLLTNGLSWMCNMESTVSIPSKSLSLDYLTVTAASARMWSMLTTVILPVICVAAGGVIWFKRRKQ